MHLIQSHSKWQWAKIWALFFIFWSFVLCPFQNTILSLFRSDSRSYTIVGSPISISTTLYLRIIYLKINRWNICIIIHSLTERKQKQNKTEWASEHLEPNLITIINIFMALVKSTIFQSLWFFEWASCLHFLY